MIPIQKIAIGTAKFGMDYGIGEGQLKIPISDTLDILDFCHNERMSMFDTAPSYGVSETLLGENKCATYAHVVTKVGKINQPIINDEALQFVEREFAHSLKSINAKQVYGLLIHDVNDLEKSGAESLFKWLDRLKDQKLVDKIGVSVYTPEEARALFQQYDFDLIQIPYNLFDQRFSETGTIEWLKEKNVEVHVRSLFLKGLLLKSDTVQGIPKPLSRHHQKFHQYMSENGLTAYDACMLFASHNSQIDRWVIGVSNKQQLQKLLNWKFEKQSEFVFSEWALADKNALDPRQW